MHKPSLPGILCVANWKSDVGYAWWLMESYWVKISELYAGRYQTYLAYPEINTVPEAITHSDIQYFAHTFAVNSLADIKQNLALIRRYNIQVLYLSDYGVSSLVYALYRLAGVKKIIVHDHTPGLRTTAGGVKKVLKTVKANFPLLSADAAFGATAFVTQRLQKTACFTANRCFTVQNGIRPFTPAANAAARIAAIGAKLPDKLIVTAARANAYKGIGFAIEVMAHLVHKLQATGFKYVLFGDGPDLESFRQQASQAAVQDYCLFPGRIDNASELLAQCYLGFQPAQGEVGYSLSILEYMYAGLPVIVPDNPSVCEATEDGKTGAIYPKEDVEAAAHAIHTYLNDPARQARHGAQATQTVAQQYTLQATHSALAHALQQVIG